MHTETWKQKAAENAAFLDKVYGRLEMDVGDYSPEERLEHTTHISALLESEKFWPSSSPSRRCISKLMTTEEQKELEDLAVWVSERVGAGMLAASHRGWGHQQSWFPVDASTPG